MCAEQGRHHHDDLSDANLMFLDSPQTEALLILVHGLKLSLHQKSSDFIVRRRVWGLRASDTLSDYLPK